MATTQIGADLIINVGTTMGSYVVVSVRDLDDEIKMKEIFDENGALKTILVFFSHDKLELELIPLSGAAPATDFVKGAICAVAPLSNYYIEEARQERTEEEARVSVTGINKGIT